MNGASRWLEASAGAIAPAASVVTTRLAASMLSQRLFDGFVSIAVTPRLSVAIPARPTRRCRQPGSTQNLRGSGRRHIYATVAWLDATAPTVRWPTTPLRGGRRHRPPAPVAQSDGQAIGP